MWQHVWQHVASVKALLGAVVIDSGSQTKRVSAPLSITTGVIRTLLTEATAVARWTFASVCGDADTAVLTRKLADRYIRATRNEPLKPINA